MEENKLDTVLKLCNNLQINDKRTRKNNLETLRQEIFKDNDTEQLRKIFNQINMYVLKCFSDSAENCRQIAIEIMQDFILNLDTNDYYLTYIFPILEKRLGSVIIVEESEEIRLQLLTFLHTIINKYQNNLLVPFLDIFSQILCKTVLDPFPMVKNESCLCISALTKAVPKHFHMQAESYAKVLVQLLSHQHFRIRIAGIKCISNVVEYGGGKISDDVLIGLANAMNDPLPGVRLAAIQTAHAWLLRHPDRYSYFPKILPTILLGLTDEVTENVREAHTAWKEIGKQYAMENEKDMKDKLDYLEEITPHYPYPLENRPSIGCRILIVRHTMRLLSAITEELNYWRVEIRRLASRLLCAVVLHNEGDITQHLQNLLPTMAKASRDSDLEVTKNVQEAGRVCGHFILPKVYCDIILPAIDAQTGPVIGFLRTLASLISGSLPENLEHKLTDICNVLLKSDVCQMRENLPHVFECCEQIILICQERCGIVEYELFTIIITILALSKEPLTEQADTLLNKLSTALKLSSVEDLYEKHSDNLLQTLRPTSSGWTLVTPERCIFEQLLTKSKQNFGINFQIILEILQNSLDVDGDGEVRLKTFIALSTILLQIENDNNIEFQKNMEQLIVEIIEPNLIWRAGRTNESIRSAAIACLCSSLPFCGDGIPVELLNTLVGLVDEKSSITRSHVLRAIAYYANAHASQLKSDTFNVLYPDIVKRLDDGIDNVRIEAALALKSLFIGLNLETFHAKTTHSAHVDYLFSTLLIHLDDHDVKFQEHILDVLQCLSVLNKELLEEKIERVKEKFRSKNICDKLLSYINTN